ncbi:MAG: hypothetical protein C4537_00470 [Acholeplasma sp.]|nr:MAG: hypothetical protein C4537_00470 [Acholeplasma sp.]
MRLSKVLGVRRVKLRNRIFTLGVIITGMLSIAFALITFYGQNAGNFVMSVDTLARQRGIAISDDPEFTFSTSRLMSDPIDDARDVTYAWLKLDEIEETNGNYVDPDHDYVAYTFYIKNEGLETVDLSYYIRITEVYNDLDKAIRVLVIDDGEETMFMKPDTTNINTYPDYMPIGQHFETQMTVMRKLIPNFRPGDIRKFTVVVWLEGNDPDTTDEILGGMIKMQMNFTIYGFEE